MGIFGVDVSNHQASFNFQGWDFAILKASEGSTFKDGRFRQHLMNARAAGCIVAAYHYQRPDNYVYQADNIESMVPKDIPVIIDVEDGSGSFDLTRNLVRELRNRGYLVPLSYIPRWHWQKVGSPSLEGLPALWASWYPDYVARPREQGILKVPASAWSNYGGLGVRLMQFTSTPHDMNWFAGTRDELYQLLYGKAGSGGGAGADEMAGWLDEDSGLAREGEAGTYTMRDLEVGNNRALWLILQVLKDISDKFTLGGVPAADLEKVADAAADKAVDKIVEDLADKDEA